MKTEGDRKIYGVSEITRLIKVTLERNFGEVWIEGELSNVRRPASGHYYFTIKDADAQISAVLFRGSQRNIKFSVEDGIKVRAFGQVSVYERSGSYQIIVRSMEEAGKGTLQAQFEELKAKLQAEGLFDKERKRLLPVLPQHVGVVTSATGAAIRDILNVVSRRFPNLHVVLAPAKVQGPGAAVEIAEAINLLNRRGGLDAMIVGRGGGSLEDLWCFNEEIVARAIAHSEIPVISAVGHEIDFTISDFVADLRAPTPSAAAELVVGRKEEFEELLQVKTTVLTSAMQNALERAQQRLRVASGSYVFREPANVVRTGLQKIESAGLQIRHALLNSLQQGQQRLDDAGMRLLHRTEINIRTRADILRQLDTKLNALNPLGVLKRGYSVTSDEHGRLVRSIKDVQAGQLLTTRVTDGKIDSEVLSKG